MNISFLGGIGSVFFVFSFLVLVFLKSGLPSRIIMKIKHDVVENGIDFREYVDDEKNKTAINTKK